jgi:hypothetical protein
MIYDTSIQDRITKQEPLDHRRSFLARNRNDRSDETTTCEQPTAFAGWIG